MTSKKTKQESKTSNNTNHFLIFVIVILAFILIFGFIRRGQEQVAPSSVQGDNAPKEKVVISGSEVDLDQKIKDFIMENPEVILDSVSNYQNQQARDRDKQKNEKLSDVYDEMIEHFPAVGPKNAKHEIIEFYDYNCGYCKQVVPVVNKVLSNYDDVRVYFVDFPILGKSSEELAMVSTAIYLLEPNKFLEAHNKLMKLGRANLDKAVEAMTSLGFDKNKLKKKAQSQEVSDFLRKNRSIGSQISITGTPAFIVNKQFFGGALSYDAISNVLDK